MPTIAALKGLPTLEVEKKKILTAVWWDGSFKAAALLSKHKIFKGIKYTTREGTLVYFDHSSFTLRYVPRNTYVLRDEDEIKYYYETGDSLLANDYKLI